MRDVLKHYLNRLQVSLKVAAYTQCSCTWRNIDYIPDYSKLYFICSGEGWLKIDGKEYYPSEGQLFLLPAGVLQSFSTINKNCFKKYWCHFSANIETRNLFNILTTPHFIDVKDREYVEGLFKKLINADRSNRITSSMLVKSTLYEIISYFIEQAGIEQISVPASDDLEKLEIINNYIENNISENIMLEELAELLHFHPSHFIRYFKKNMGVTPIHYINEIRMERAKNLLSTTDLTVSQIGGLIGLPDIYHFSKAFKKFSGFSPSEFRKMC